MVKLVDTPDLGSGAVRCGGSSPFARTFNNIYMILYLFVDGIGYGQNNPNQNPFAKFAQSFFLPLCLKSIPSNNPCFKLIYKPIDASMDISGSPQSGTGQTAIWTGINTSKFLGHHVAGFPTYTLKKIIQKYSMLKILQENGYRASILNTYSPSYFQFIINKPRHIAASTLIQQAAGHELKSVDAMRREEGLYMDITHEIFQKVSNKSLEPDDELLKLRDPFEEGQRLYRIAQKNDLSIYEFFLTDKIGHDTDWTLAERVIFVYEKFIEGLLSVFDETKDTLILTSDHGNFEDFSHGAHTTNQVPLVLYGQNIKQFYLQVDSIYQIVLIIYKLLNIEIDLSSPTIE